MIWDPAAQPQAAIRLAASVVGLPGAALCPGPLFAAAALDSARTQGLKIVRQYNPLSVTFGPDGRLWARAANQVLCGEPSGDGASLYPLQPYWTNDPGWNQVYALAVGNQSVLVGERAGAVRALDSRNPKIQLAFWKLSETDPIRSIALHGDETWAVAGTQDGLLHLLWLTQPAPVQTISEQMGSVDTVTVSVEGLVATGTREGTVKLWRCRALDWKNC